ncbi:Ig-like domain repeat protein [Agreia sp. COWG]|uniref:Ig-like domain repeat protein n=1 Tax=Agreia sp. COWG TaxID=2773266 RepID=UPI001926DF42|nr:Ig-like domain repeat protein [Agreia sp. COWG]CAD5990663.1 putative Ig-like domain (Group 3) [Agreia sp. COWG]
MRSPSPCLTAALSLGALLAVGIVDWSATASASAAEPLPSISVVDATGASTGALADLSATGQGKYTLSTSLVCPAEATNFELAIVEGVKTAPDQFFSPQNIANYRYSTFADRPLSSGGLVPATDQFAGAADTWWDSSVGTMMDLSTLKPGEYSLSVTCTTVGATMSWNSETRLVTQAWTPLTITETSWSVPAAVAPAAETTTSLSATKSATDEAAADLVATVVATSGTPSGSVQFFDGATAVGSPVTVSGSGGASLTASGLTGGEHSFTASFSATDPALFAGSTSAPALVTVVGSTKAQTSVTLTGSASGTDANLVATVSSAGAPLTAAAGRVEFSDGEGAKVSDAAVNAAGVATVTIAGLTQGASYKYTATYVATSGENYLTSAASSAITVDVARANETPLLTAGGVVVPGQKYRVVSPAATFVAGETVRGEIHSTPILLTETSAARQDGSVEFVFTAPSELVAGSSHELVLTGAAGAEYTVAFSVKAADSAVVPASTLKPGTNSPVGFATDWVGRVAQAPQGMTGLFAGLIGLAALLVAGVAWVTTRRGRLHSSAN